MKNLINTMLIFKLTITIDFKTCTHNEVAMGQTSEYVDANQQ
jgi:hypothetical protein